MSAAVGALPAAFTAEHATWMAALLQGLLRAEHQAEAGRVIQACETVPGFPQLVASLAAEPTTPLPESARLIAIICCRNFVRRHWGAGDRGNASMAIPEHERCWLRERFLRAALEERSDLPASQWALLTSRVARSDWPRAWPSCFALVMEACHSQARTLGSVDPASPEAAAIDFGVARASRLLREMLADVSSKALPSARSNAAALCAELLGPAAALWAAVHAAYAARLGAAAAAGGLGRGAALVSSCARLARSHRSCTRIVSLVLRSLPHTAWTTGPAAAAAVVDLGRGLAALLGARQQADAGVYATAGAGCELQNSAAATACDKAASTLAKTALALQEAQPLVLAASGAAAAFAQVRRRGGGCVRGGSASCASVSSQLCSSLVNSSWAGHKLPWQLSPCESTCLPLHS